MPVFETPGSVSLQIKLPSGRVVVRTADEPKTTVEVVGTGRRGRDAAEDVAVRADERPGGHVITIEQEDHIRWGPIQISWGGGVEVLVTCPTGANLEFAGGSTELRVEGRLGDVSVRSASGDIRLGDVSRKLQVKTASGDVSIEAIESEASLITVSGDLDVGRMDGSLTARTVSGDVDVVAIGGRVWVTSMSGDVDLKSVEAGDVRIQTVSGDVRLAVGRGTRVFIDAASVSGDLGSELGIADESPAEGQGQIVPLHVKTVSGDVAIIRAAESVSA